MMKHFKDLRSFSYKVEKNKFFYLGISVTRRHKEPFHENFMMLLNQTKQILTQRSMSLAGRINSVKIKNSRATGRSSFPEVS